MKVFKNFLVVLSFGLIFIILVSCSGAGNLYGPESSLKEEGEEDTGLLDGESYNKLEENPYIYTDYTNATYFSMDSNTAAYSNLRRQINNGSITKDVIKTDELINYFSYKFPGPEEGDFASVGYLADCPWNSSKKLLTLGVATKEVALDENIKNNIVFLIDVSGSMSSDNKLGLIKEAFKLFVKELNPDDLVSIVTYANGVNVVCNGIKAENDNKLIRKVNGLSARGGTAGGAGLEKAYSVAEENLIEGGNNRIIIASDGDFNIGMSSQTELQEYMSTKLEKGIYVTTLGFGMGNYKDTTMETLAKYGNGTYAYIDTLLEAEKVLVDDLKTNLITVAKDVKNKVEFNKDLVEAYRLIGYENKQISEDDFNNEETDAGEVGSNHQTVVVFELEMKASANITEQSEICNLHIKYKDPITDESKEYQNVFTQKGLTSESKFDLNEVKFVYSLVEFSLLLRESNYRGTANYQHLVDSLNNNPSIDNDKLRGEFTELVDIAKRNNLIGESKEIIETNKKIITVVMNNAIISVVVNDKSSLTVQTLITEIFGSYESYKYDYQVALDADFEEPFVPTIVTENMVLYLRIYSKETNVE